MLKMHNPLVAFSNSYLLWRKYCTLRYAFFYRTGLGVLDSHGKGVRKSYDDYFLNLISPWQAFASCFQVNKSEEGR